MTDTRKTDTGSQIVGSILAVPTFLVVYIVAAIIVNILFTFFNSVSNGEPTRWVELLAFGISGFAAVFAGRWTLDRAFRHWNGWPTFIAVEALLILAGLGDWFFAPEEDRWLAALKTVQSVVATGAMWVYLIRRESID